MAERDEDDADEHTDWIDERSIAADSWSVKSEYGSTLDGEDPRHAEMDVINPVEDRSSTGRLVITAPLTNEPCLAEHHRTAEGSEDLGGQWCITLLSVQHSKSESHRTGPCQISSKSVGNH